MCAIKDFHDIASAMQSMLQNRLQVQVGVCRYENRAYWKDVHEQSQAYKDFVQRMKDAKLEPEMDVQVFYETDIGHMCG